MRGLGLLLAVDPGPVPPAPGAPPAQAPPAPAPGAQPPAGAQTPPPTQTQGENGAIHDFFEGVAENFHQEAANALDYALAWVRDSGTLRIDDANGWFVQQYEVMIAMAAWVMLPLVIIAIAQAVAKGAMDQLVKSAVVFPAIALIGAVVAMQVVVLLIEIVDSFSGLFLDSIDDNLTAFQNALRRSPVEENLIISIILTVTLMVVSFATIVILVVRDAAIYISSAFLPLGFAMLVWPASAKWTRRIVEFLIAMIFSKLVMIAAISLAMAAFLGAGDQFAAAEESLTLNGSATTTAGDVLIGEDLTDGATWGAVFTYILAIVMLGFAVFAPQATFAVIGSLALDNVAQDVQGMMQRPSAFRWMILRMRAGQFMSQVVRQPVPEGQDELQAGQGSLLQQRGIRRRAQEDNDRRRNGEAALNAKGITRNPRTDSFEINDNEVQFLTARLGAMEADQIRRMSASGDANEVNLAYERLWAEQEGRVEVIPPGGPRNPTGANIFRITTSDWDATAYDPATGTTGRNVTHTEDRVISNIVSVMPGRRGQTINRVDGAQVRQLIEEREQDQNATAAGSDSWSVTVRSGMGPRNEYDRGNTAQIRDVMENQQNADPVNTPGAGPRRVYRFDSGGNRPPR